MGAGGKAPRRVGAPLLRSSEVPPSVAESFILSGYRRPGYTFAQCVRSAFRATNETGNFWTHFLAVFVFAFHCLEPCGAKGPLPGALSDPFYYPLWSYCLGVCGLLVASSMAHLFNSMSLVVREICFYIDYGTISAYTVGSSLAYFYYIHPPAVPLSALGAANLSGSAWPGGTDGGGWLSAGMGRTGAWFEALYVPSACLVALFCTLACCSTRHQWPRYRYLIRTLVFLLPFVVVSIPVFCKLWQAGGGPEMRRFFLRHCCWLLASGIFNVSKIPERFSPGKFDIWGHSHQWFHCCTFMSILDELHMIRAEIRELQARRPLLPRTPTACSTFGVMLLLAVLLTGIVGWFGARAYSHLQHPQAEKGE